MDVIEITINNKVKGEAMIPKGQSNSLIENKLTTPFLKNKRLTDTLYCTRHNIEN